MFERKVKRGQYIVSLNHKAGTGFFNYKVDKRMTFAAFMQGVIGEANQRFGDHSLIAISKVT